MNAVAPQMAREPVRATRRGKMTVVRKIRIWGLAKGLCAWCNKPVEMFGPTVVYDHRTPLALGGADTDENIRPLHTRPCDKLKTAFDKKLIAKAMRLIARAAGTRRERKAIASRGFDKSLKRGFDGKVVRR